MSAHRLRFAPLAAAAWLAGCSMMPTYERPPAPVPGDWPHAAAPAGTPADALAWQAFFSDARLRELIGIALRNNRDLRVAALNIEQARAQYDIRRADRFPTVNAAVTGGQGGAIGVGQNANSVARARTGAGGAGIVATGTTIITTSSISGGFNGSGAVRADAITFIGGANALTLDTGWSLTGNIGVNGTGTAATFAQTTIDASVANIITGTGGVIVDDAGSGRVLTLSGINTYTGSTTVAAGGLTLNKSGGALSDTTAVTVASGATLTVLANDTIGSLAGDKLFWEVDQRYWHRHSLRPGLTGLAQIRGLRGATDQESDLSSRLQADLEYLAGWSILRDIRILFATVGVLVHDRAF